MTFPVNTSDRDVKMLDNWFVADMSLPNILIKFWKFGCLAVKVMFLEYEHV